MKLRTFRHLSAALTLLAVPTLLSAQDDRLSIHGSINAAYGKTDGLPYFGFNKDGTTDYRTVTLLFGYKIGDRDRMVVQLINRRLGTSPLNDEFPDMQPVWAFYEHKFGNGVSAKIGRSPIPRGLFNEIRYIGTLLPLYRVGGAGVYGETFEYIDGAVLAKKFDLGADWGLESSVFAGGSTFRGTLATATGVTVVNQREESAVGTQVWLQTPIQGVKFGGFVSSYQPTPAAALPASQRPNRTLAYLWSAEANFDKVFFRSEYQGISSAAPNYAELRGWYVHGGVKPRPELSLTAEYGGLNTNLRFPAPITNEINLPASRELILGAAWHASAQVAFKLEGHRTEGYNFDSPVPNVIPPTGAPFVARLAAPSKANILVASVAVSF